MIAEGRVALRPEQYPDGTSYVPQNQIIVTMSDLDARAVYSCIRSLAKRAKISEQQLSESSAGQLLQLIASLQSVVGTLRDD